MTARLHTVRSRAFEQADSHSAIAGIEVIAFGSICYVLCLSGQCFVDVYRGVFADASPAVGPGGVRGDQPFFLGARLFLSAPFQRCCGDWSALTEVAGDGFAVWVERVDCGVAIIVDRVEARIVIGFGL